MDRQTANVSFETTEDATLVVCIYSEDGEEMLVSATSDVETGQTEAKVYIEENLPEYFYLRSFLVNSETLRPLCTSYETPNYTKEMQEFLAKTTDDFEKEKVLNLDEDKTNNFAVYNDRTIIITEKKDVNKIIKADNTNLIYVIKNADTDITSLQKGDIFSYKYNDGEVLVVKIASIAKDGTTVTITGENTSLEEVFDYVKIDTEAGTEDVTVDTSKMEEGLIYNGLVDGNTEDRLRKLDAEGNISKSLSYDFGKLELASGNVKISGSMGLKLNFSFKINIALLYQYCELKIDYTIDISAYVTGKINPYNIPLGYIALDPVSGIGIGLIPYFTIEASGKIELNGKLSGTAGAYASTETGLGNLTTTPQYYGEIKNEVTIFVGLGIDPNITVFHKKIDSLEIKAVAGGEIKASITEPVLNNSGKIHACKNCINGEIYGKAELSVDASFIDKNKFPNGINIKPKKKICDLHYSFDFNEFEFKPCSHYKFKIDITVTDQKGNAIPKVDIRSDFYINYQGQNHIVQNAADFVKSDIITTDGKGTAFAYLTAGTYTLTASAKDYATAKQTVVITDDVKSTRIVLKKSTTKPTTSPSDKPDDEPTNSPSDKPTDNPYGNPTNSPTEQPTSSPSDDPGSISASDIVSVSLGYDYSGAVTKDGSLYMWGSNSYGQLGDGTTENKAAPVKVLDNVASVSLGYYHSGAVTKDGSLYMWGYNIYGVLGNETTRYTTPVKIFDNVVSVSLGSSHSGAVTKDGSLYMWGSNSEGQLGDGTRDDKPTPVKVLDNVASVSLGYYHSGAVTKDGSLYMWGYNSSGQLGDGTTENNAAPVKVLDNVTSVSLGGSHSGAVTKDGSLYMWGYNSSGQLGNKKMEKVEIPVSDVSYRSLSLASANNSIRTKSLGMDNLYIAANAGKQLKGISRQSKDFTSLLPNETYNFYILKSRSAENVLSPDNLLYLKQYVSDRTGTINVTYQLNETSGYDEPFVVGMSRPDLSDAQVEIPDLIYNGSEQYIYPKVYYKDNELSEG